MTSDDELDQTLSLVDYRARVAEIYVDVRRRGADREAWQRWTTARTDLFRTHPQSPLDARRRASPQPVTYFDHDPTWRVIGTVEPSTDDPDGRRPTAIAAEGSTWTAVGSVSFERLGEVHRLGLYRLDGYGGGLFLPFGDDTNGVSTYGGGRYLLDGPKSADLGRYEPGRLLLDFNFAYHPSCAWNPQWACPLAPPANRLAVEVNAGERGPAPSR